MRKKNLTEIHQLKNKQITASYLLLSAFIFTIAFMLLRFPSQAGEGVKYGLNLCAGTVIPSLFPFMVLSSFFAESGLCSKIGSLFNKFTRLIFRQPGISSSVILLSNIGGLPIGAKMVKQLYEKEQITKEQGQRLLLFCINPGPAFVISSVGHYMLGSSKAGIILFFSQMTASLLVGFLSRFIADDSDIEKICVKKEDKPEFIQSLVSAVTQSTSGMLAICSWVIIFSSLENLIEVFDFSDGAKLFLNCILEVTNGCNAASGKLPIPIIAGIIGWSGFCAHFQVISSVIKLRMKLKYFLTGRIINGALSVIVCQMLLYFFPIETDVFSSSVKGITASTSACFSVSLGMFLMCLLLLLGDNFKIGKRKQRCKN